MAETPLDVPNGRVAMSGGCRTASFARVAVAIAALGVAVALTQGDAAWAQSRSSGLPAIAISSVIAAEPTTETSLQIRISPADAVPRQSFLRIQGLPRTVSLSDGYSIAPGAWAIPLGALPGLRLAAPTGSEGRFEVTVSLVTSDGIVLSEAKATLLIAPPGQRQQPPTTTAARPPQPLAQPPQPQGPQLSREDRERAMKLLDRGNQLMAAKDFSAAQHFYVRAAEMGLAEAAMALGKRYDPDELGRLGAIGMQADRESARKWYEKARELGSADADAFLRRMGGR
jgi:hypothetical protein